MTNSHDVVVVGDGPAGSALAAACVERDIDVVLAGRDEPWTATYSVWVDEVGDVPFAATCDSVMAYGARPHRIDRTYGVLDNDENPIGLISDKALAIGGGVVEAILTRGQSPFR